MLPRAGLLSLLPLSLLALSSIYLYLYVFYLLTYYPVSVRIQNIGTPTRVLTFNRKCDGLVQRPYHKDKAWERPPL